MEPAFSFPACLFLHYPSPFPPPISTALAYPQSAADVPKTWYGPEEYLAFDNAAEGRFEYANGRITPVGAPGIINVFDPTFRAWGQPCAL